MNKQLLSRKNLLCVVGIFALAVRGIAFFCYWHSPLRFFHLVPGLDMQTLLHFSEWCKAYPPLFVVHRFLIFAVWKLNNCTHCPEAVVAVQMVLGALGAVALTDCVLMLWGKRRLALVCGLFSACYAPFLLYESVILQEAVMVNLTLFSFWAMLKTGQTHVRWKKFALGALFALSLPGRPVALFFLPGCAGFLLLRFRKKHQLRRLLLPALGVLAVLGGATLFNWCFARTPSIFFRVMPYTLQYHAQQTAPLSSAPQKNALSPAVRAGVRALGNTPKLFLPLELPENLNYYFLRREFPVLRMLPGPGLLLPLAVAGLLTLVCPPRRKREFLILLPLLLLSPLLCAREPIGRYRLYLCPYLILAAGALAVHLKALSLRKRLRVAAGCICVAAGLVLLSPAAYERSSDFLSWAIALEAKGENPVRCLETAWKRSEYSSTGAAVRLILWHLRHNEPLVAAVVASEGVQSGRGPQELMRYYLGMSLLAARMPEQACSVFRSLDPARLPARLRSRYVRMRADVERFMKENKQQGR